MSPEIRWQGRRACRRVIIAALACALVSIPMIYGLERFVLSMSQNRSATREAPPGPFAQIEAPGLIRPPTYGAEGSGMLDEDEVIGVEVASRARAYRLAALGGRTTHVVNDMLGGVPVSVAYCDLTDCVRGYTDPKGTAPLSLSVGGLYVDNGPQMVLKLDGIFYFHKSGRPIEPGPGSSPIPYGPIETTRTTWKEWVRRHPETDVYTGKPPVDRADLIAPK